MIKSRLYVVLAVLGVLAGALGLLYQFGPHAGLFPKCLLRQWTGFHCPGCGMTRAVDATLHGRLLEAFAYNPLIMVLLPLTLIAVAFELVAWVWDRPPIIRYRVNKRLALWLLAIVLVFGILRNIPSWPFTLLAP